MKKVIVEKSEPKLIFSAPINEKTSKWGVYAVPRMWRTLKGDLIIRFNGEQDCSSSENMYQAPNLYFISKDNGKSWDPIDDMSVVEDLQIWISTEFPYFRRANGDALSIDFCNGKFSKIEDSVPYLFEVMWPNKNVITKIYRYGDLPRECKTLELSTVNTEKGTREICDLAINFDDLLVYSVSSSLLDDKWYYEKEQYVRHYHFMIHFNSITELKDGTLLAIAFGQEPTEKEIYYLTAYLLASTDGGKTWEMRSQFTKKDKEIFKYGYYLESSINAGDDGIVRALLRTEVCIDPAVEYPIADTIYFESQDDGYTWSAPLSISDSSVTPHLVYLKDDILLAIYGRPGIHFKYSLDKGKTWSESHSIIGLTLDEERANGASDRDSKYFDTSSYSNTFVEKISDDTVLVCYNDMRYDEGDGQKHKAGFVRTITIKYE